MSVSNITCVCGNIKKKNNPVPGRVYYCSDKCRRESTVRQDGTYLCKKCGKWLLESFFYWRKDSRYLTGKCRTPNCNDCRTTVRNEYHIENRKRAKDKHDRWRKKRLGEGGTSALKWYFERHMSAYKRRSIKKSILIDINVDYLMGIFEKQNGNCYYSGTPLVWNNYGMGKARHKSMSLDRLDPTLGYVMGNVVLCHFFINTAKGNLSEKDFYSLCSKIVKQSETRL